MGIVTKKDNKMQPYIDSALKCAMACAECLRACLDEPDLNARRNCVATLIDCAKICELTACMMASSSQFHKDMCNLCSKVCEKCAAECNMFKDEHCKKCAEICTTCASDCKKSATM